MIDWLLRRLEQNPAATFSEDELRKLDGGAFEALKVEGLLRKLSDSGESLLRGGRLLSIVQDPGGVAEAIDDEDVEFEPVAVSPCDLDRWRFELPVFAEKFRLRNGLGGTGGLLEERLYCLGERTVSELVVLALLSHGDFGLTILQALPGIAPGSFREFTVLTPSRRIELRNRRQLEPLGIRVYELDEDDPLAIPRESTKESRAPTRASLTYSPDFSTVTASGRTWSFVGKQAEAIGKFVEQWERGVPELNQQFVLSEVDSKATRLRDLFKGSPAWETLLVPGSRSGFYRLAIDEIP